MANNYYVEFIQSPILWFQQSKWQITVNPWWKIASQSDVNITIDVINKELAKTWMKVVSIISIWELWKKIV